MPIIKFKFSTGLSIIELLIVIVIIGILAAITAPMYIGYQKSSRDARRKSDLRTFKRLMEEAKNMCSSAIGYPTPGAGGTTSTAYFNDPTHQTNSITYILKDMGFKNAMDLQDSLYTNELGTYKYSFDRSNEYSTFSAQKACPNSTGTLTYWSAAAYYAWAQLENTNDPDAIKSAKECSNLNNPDSSWAASHTNVFFVCSN